jgi:hypothetical protein
MFKEISAIKDRKKDTNKIPQRSNTSVASYRKLQIRLGYKNSKITFKEALISISAFISSKVNQGRTYLQKRIELDTKRKEQKKSKLLQIRIAKKEISDIRKARLSEQFKRLSSVFTFNKKFPDSTKSVTRLDMWKSFITGIAFTVIFILTPYESYNWLKALPNPQLLSRRDLQVTTKIFDRKGVLLYEIYQDQNRTPLPLNSIPKSIISATISIEDKTFIGIRVSIANSTNWKPFFNVQGGSTITTINKSALLSPGKVKEN